MVKQYNLEQMKHVIENIQYMNKFTDDELRLKSNNERLGLDGDNRNIFHTLERLGDPFIQKVDDYLEDVDQHCGDAATAWDLEIPHYTWLKKIQNRILTENEYEGMLNGTEPINEWTMKFSNLGEVVERTFKDYLK